MGQKIKRNEKVNKFMRKTAFLLKNESLSDIIQLSYEKGENSI